MEEIIQAFGIDGRLIIIQIVNFAILMGALGYFLYTPILNMLAVREEKIAQGMKDAESAASARAAAEEEKKIVLTSAHQSAEEVAKRAKLAADATTATLLFEAQTKATATLKDAEVKAEQLRAKITKEAEAEIAKIAVLAAEKILRTQTS